MPTPCLKISDSNNWIAGSAAPQTVAAEPPAGCVISQQWRALAIADLDWDNAQSAPHKAWGMMFGHGAGPALAAGAGGIAVHDAALIDALPHLVWSAGADGLITSVNARWLAFADAPQASDARWTNILHPEEQAPAWSAWLAHLASGAPYEANHRLRQHDGNHRWALARAVPVRDSGGAIAGWCGTFTDIHALKSSEAERDFLACELTHRIQNLFAVVESLLSLSARDQPQAAHFAATAIERVRSLARANEYVRPRHGQVPAGNGQTTLHGLLTVMLAPYQPTGIGTAESAIITISGPDLRIGAGSATLLALVVHELATNAAKYGALSQGVGRVAVDTHVAAGQLRMVWTESGGPPIAAPPSGRGFGTLLTDRALRHPLGGEVDRRWSASGLTVTIKMPCDRLAA